MHGTFSGVSTLIKRAKGGLKSSLRPKKCFGGLPKRKKWLLILMKKIDMLVNLIARFQVIAGILSLASIACIIPLQVLCRYAFNAPLAWPEDLATGFLVWLAFLGATVLYKQKGLVTVEFFMRYFNEKLAFVISLTIDILIGFLSLFVVIYAYRLNTLQMMSYSVGTGIPRAFFYSLPLLVNFVVMFIYSVYLILKKILSRT